MHVTFVFPLLLYHWGRCYYSCFWQRFAYFCLPNCWVQFTGGSHLVYLKTHFCFRFLWSGNLSHKLWLFWPNQIQLLFEFCVQRWSGMDFKKSLVCHFSKQILCSCMSCFSYQALVPEDIIWFKKCLIDISYVPRCFIIAITKIGLVCAF